MQIAGATLDIWPTQFGFLFGPGHGHGQDKSKTLRCLSRFLHN